MRNRISAQFLLPSRFRPYTPANGTSSALSPSFRAFPPPSAARQAALNETGKYCPHVWERRRGPPPHLCLIATDDERIARAAGPGAEVAMTSPDLPNGIARAPRPPQDPSTT
jgi:hypothetical protein